MERGQHKRRQSEALAILTKQLRRRCGNLPNWAIIRLKQAIVEQLELWAE